MYLPGYYGDPVEEHWALLNGVTIWDGTRAAIPTRSRASMRSTSWVADRYAADGIVSHRTVRERYDVPPPKDGDFGAPVQTEAAARRRR
jgi:hypothetical protein